MVFLTRPCVWVSLKEQKWLQGIGAPESPLSIGWLPTAASLKLSSWRPVAPFPSGPQCVCNPPKLSLMDRVWYCSSSITQDLVIHHPLPCPLFLCCASPRESVCLSELLESCVVLALRVRLALGVARVLCCASLKSPADSRSSQSWNCLWLYELTVLFQLMYMPIQLRDLVLGMVYKVFTLWRKYKDSRKCRWMVGMREMQRFKSYSAFLYWDRNGLKSR